MGKGSGLQQSAGRPPAVSKEGFKNAAKNSAGVLSNIAKKLGVSRQSVYNFINANKEFAVPILKQEKEQIIDMAENSLFSQVQKQEQWATKYLLSTIGRKRGYVERQEIEVSQKTINLNINASVDELDVNKES